MGYGKEIYRKAEDELNARRQRAFSDAQTRRERIYDELPEVRTLESKLVRTGVSAARAVFAGGDTKDVLSRLRDENLRTQAELQQVLSSKGYRPEDLEERYFCPACRDRGYIDGKMCACLKRLLRDTAYNELNERSPLPLEASRFDTFDLGYYPDSNTPDGKNLRAHMRRVYDTCYDYAESFCKTSRSILMDGNTGLGKTHLSLAIAGRVIDRGFGVIYGSAPDLISMLERENFSREHERVVLERLEGCDLLIIDDLGTEFPSAFSKSAVYNLINARVVRNKPTIINTNFTLSEMKAAYSDRLVSRLVGENIMLHFYGEDIRIARKRKNRSSE